MPNASCPVCSLTPVTQCGKCYSEVTGLSPINQPTACFPQKVMLSLPSTWHKYVHMHTNVQTNEWINLCTYVPVHTHIHTHTHTRARAHANTHTRTHTRTHTHEHKHIHKHTRAHYIPLKWLSVVLAWMHAGNGENCGVPEGIIPAHTGGCVKHHHPHDPWNFFMCTQHMKVLVQPCTT
jgi:hypothetical protein